MTWSYRVLHTVSKTGQADVTENHRFEIIEAYYAEDGETVESWMKPANTKAYGETLGELRNDLALMVQALDRPVLERKDLPGA